ncbi:MAG: CpsD/CapB family tyrosine-protein kinase [Bacilli bacterium]
MAKIDNNNETNSPIITDFESIASEAIQKLQTNITFSSFEKKIKIIGVTSSVQGEGKSTLLVNMANIYASKGAKVCVVDLDLRRSNVHHLYNVPNKIGIVEYVTGEANISDIIEHSTTGVDVIPSGSKVPFPTSVLESPKIHALLDELKNMYDYVLVDATPVLVVADATIVSKYLDGYIFATEQNHTKKSNVVESLKILKSSGANIIGIVITKSKEMEKNKEQYYYYQDTK